MNPASGRVSRNSLPINLHNPVYVPGINAGRVVCLGSGDFYFFSIYVLRSIFTKLRNTVTESVSPYALHWVHVEVEQNQTELGCVRSVVKALQVVSDFMLISPGRVFISGGSCHCSEFHEGGLQVAQN